MKKRKDNRKKIIHLFANERELLEEPSIGTATTTGTTSSLNSAGDGRSATKDYSGSSSSGRRGRRRRTV